jgi:putative glutamine amidotransferase
MEENKIYIGITESESKFINYLDWIIGDSKNVETVVLSASKQNKLALQKCHALLLTGGIDVDPFFYQPTLSDYPNKPVAWNRERDEFEIAVFQSALALHMPVLGICRGLQLVNAALNGTLTPDIEATGKQNHRSQNGADYIHSVALNENSLLASITNVKEGTVNSAHHQSIDTIAPDLTINCWAAEHIIEGIEWKEPFNKSPLICVQWHPERIENNNTNPLSKNIREWFLSEAIKYSK